MELIGNYRCVNIVSVSFPHFSLLPLPFPLISLPFPLLPHSPLPSLPSPLFLAHLQAKKALKEVPKDDEEVDRKEEGEIDRGFTESSSSSEDELTEAGKVAKCSMAEIGGTLLDNNVYYHI